MLDGEEHLTDNERTILVYVHQELNNVNILSIVVNI